MQLVQNYYEKQVPSSWYFHFKDIIYTSYGSGLQVSYFEGAFEYLKNAYKLEPFPHEAN